MRFEVRTVAGNWLEAVFLDRAAAEKYLTELFHKLRLRCVIKEVP